MADSSNSQKINTTSLNERRFLYHPFIFYVFVLLVFLWTINANLNHIAENQVVALRHSVLLYTSKDSNSANLERFAQTSLHIRTIDLLRPNSGTMVYELTRSRTAVSPTLVIPEGMGNRIVIGVPAIQHALKPLEHSLAPTTAAKQALIVMACLVLLSVVLASELKPFVTLFPLIGMIAIAGMGGYCLTCSTHRSVFTAIAPMGGLLYFAFAALLYSYPVLRNRSAFLAFLLISGLIPFVQAYLLTIEPKLCPSCLIITFVSFSYFLITAQSLREAKVPGIQISRWVIPVFPVLFLILIVRQSLLLSGRIRIDKPAEEPQVSFVGRQLKQYLSPDTIVKPGVLYVVSQSGCSACAEAEHILPKLGIQFQIIQPCSMWRKEGCFENKNASFATPMLLICDAKGQVNFQHNGWSSDPDAISSVQQQIQTTLQRIQR